MTSDMEYVNLGNSGLKVSRIILGCMSYGSKQWAHWVMEEDESLEMLRYAYERGINTWDTADVYSNGMSEKIIGKALKKYNIPRERVVIMTKVFFIVDEEKMESPSPTKMMSGEFVNRVGLSRKHIMGAVERSVERLGTYIDVLQIHRLDHQTPGEEIMRGLNDVVERGLARYIGASSMATWQFQKLQNTAEKHGWHKFISMQDMYNLLYREEEREMIPYCQNSGVGVIPWFALAAGVLTRPWGEAPTPRSQDDAFREALLGQTDADETIVNRVQEVAQKKGVAMAQVAIAWLLSKKGVNPILGLSSHRRVDEAVAALHVKLTEDEIKFLEKPYKPRFVTGYV